MYHLKVLTDEIRQQIKNGWRVGVEENGALTIYEVVSRLGSQLKGDEKWLIYPKDSGKEEGPATHNPRFFADLPVDRIVYCHSKSSGQRYILETLIDLYE